MWNEPTEKQLDKIPKFYETEEIGLDGKIMHMHFFLGSNDWYAAEYDSIDRVFFGYAILNGDHMNSEWGYISYDELRDTNLHGMEVDRDLHWEPKAARFIDAYRKLG